MPHGVQVSEATKREFWGLIRAGTHTPAQAAIAVGASKHAGNMWFRHAGGVIPPAPSCRPVSYRRLRAGEREQIGLLHAAGASLKQIQEAVGRPACTISRELARNRDSTGRYVPSTAQLQAEQRARRPKPAKLATDTALCAWVHGKLEVNWSPEEIANVLKMPHHPEEPDKPAGSVCAETIYQTIYIQARGGLRRELAAHLRTRRAKRVPRNRPEERRGKLKDTISISERPASVADRAIEGHWEGDLIMGRDNGSCIGTLVERRTRFVMLVHMPGRHTAQAFHDAVIPVLNTLPEQLKKTLTWDNGKEMAKHRQIGFATGMQVYFADPGKPWMRGSNENTNGLLRQYFPKSTSLRKYTPADLIDVAAQLNARPRQTLGWHSPGYRLNELLSHPFTPVLH
jgi:IS30 family transposase